MDINNNIHLLHIIIKMNNNINNIDLFQIKIKNE